LFVTDDVSAHVSYGARPNAMVVERHYQWKTACIPNVYM